MKSFVEETICVVHGICDKFEGVKIVTTPTLSATLAADYEALQNDLREANEMTSALQRELAGKSNEFALLRQVFEKTRRDLETLQSGIGALRAERHGLANDLMRTTALEEDLAAVKAERDGLRTIVEKNHLQIRELRVKLNQANGALTEANAALAAKRRAPDPKWVD